MNQRFVLCLVAGMLAMAFAGASAAAAPVDTNKVLDGFLAAVEKNASATADQKRIVGELVKQLRESPEDRSAAITESLRLLHPEFKDALVALGEDNLGAAIVNLSKLRESNDPYLAAAASFYLARA